MDKDKHKELRRNIGDIVINRIKRYNEQILFFSSHSWIRRNINYIFLLFMCLLIDLSFLVFFSIKHSDLLYKWIPFCCILALIYIGYFSTLASCLLYFKDNLYRNPELIATNNFNSYYRNEIDLVDFLNRKTFLINGLMEENTFDLKVTGLHSDVIKNIINTCCKSLKFVQPVNFSREDRMMILVKQIEKSDSTKQDKIVSINWLCGHLSKLSRFEALKNNFFYFILESDTYNAVMKKQMKSLDLIRSIADNAIEKLNQESSYEIK